MIAGMQSPEAGRLEADVRALCAADDLRWLRADLAGGEIYIGLAMQR